MKKEGPNHKRIIELLRETYPNAGPGLDFENPYQLLIATILSAQTTDVRVNIVTKDLFKKYPSPFELAKASQKEIEEEIKTIGLYRNKAKHLMGTAAILSEKYQGQVPESREELMELPGVGRKTANVVISNAFGQPAIAVDTHVFRVSRRLCLATASTVDGVEKDLMKIIAQEDWTAAHHWLIWHGRLLCKSQNPICSDCPLAAECCYWQDSQQRPD